MGAVPSRAPSRSRSHLGIAAFPMALVAALAICGCGSGSAPREASGAAAFATHCSTCHSISAPASRRQQGGALGGYRLPRRELRQYAAEMPVINGRLSARELRAVVGYVLSVERRRKAD